MSIATLSAVLKQQASPVRAGLAVPVRCARSSIGPGLLRGRSSKPGTSRCVVSAQLRYAPQLTAEPMADLTDPTSENEGRGGEAELDGLIAAMVELASIQTDMLRVLDSPMQAPIQSDGIYGDIRAKYDHDMRASKLRDLRSRSQNVLRWLLARQREQP